LFLNALSSDLAIQPTNRMVGSLKVSSIVGLGDSNSIDDDLRRRHHVRSLRLRRARQISALVGYATFGCRCQNGLLTNYCVAYSCL
jgi:hypothetical protein